MRVLTDEELRTWVEENVPVDPEVYWPTETIRAFESHVLEMHEEAGLLVDGRPEGAGR